MSFQKNEVLYRKYFLTFKKKYFHKNIFCNNFPEKFNWCPASKNPNAEK